MTEGYKFKTAFTICYSTYESLVLLPGLINTLCTFQKLMNSIFSDMLDEILSVYLDNLLVFGANIKFQYDDICKTLEQLRENKLNAKSSKYEFTVSTLATL